VTTKDINGVAIRCKMIPYPSLVFIRKQYVLWPNSNKCPR